MGSAGKRKEGKRTSEVPHIVSALLLSHIISLNLHNRPPGKSSLKISQGLSKFLSKLTNQSSVFLLSGSVKIRGAILGKLFCNSSVK